LPQGAIDDHKEALLTGFRSILPFNIYLPAIKLVDTGPFSRHAMASPCFRVLSQVVSHVLVEQILSVSPVLWYSAWSGLLWVQFVSGVAAWQ